MIESTDLQTIGDVHKAINRANIVYVIPRSGTSERWVSIAKDEARYLISGIPLDAKANEYEMGGDRFARITIYGELYLG